MYLAGFGAGARRDLLPAAEVIGTVAARAARARGDLPPTEVLGASDSISLSDADNVESCAAWSDPVAVCVYTEFTTTGLKI